MQNFKLVHEHFSTYDLLHSLPPDTPNHIYLRTNGVVSEGTPAIAVAMENTEDFSKFPEFHIAIFQTMFYVKGTRLGGCMIAKMPPHSEIPEHADDGPCGHYYDRYHLVLKGTNTDFHCGDEMVQMHTGELWWFDQTKPHKVFNKSDKDRVHLIMDIKS